MRKFLFLAILGPILFIAYLVFAQNTNADSVEDSVYIVSETSFEHSQETDLYYEEKQESMGYQGSANKLLGYVWTKTGDLVNILKELCVSGFEDTKPLASAQGATLLKLLQGSNELSTSVIKALGPGQEIFQASHHPWIFLMSLSFGTLLLSLWFLRLSTGVSPPLGQFTGPVR